MPEAQVTIRSCRAGIVRPANIFHSQSSPGECVCKSNQFRPDQVEVRRAEQVRSRPSHCLAVRACQIRSPGYPRDLVTCGVSVCDDESTAVCRIATVLSIACRWSKGGRCFLDRPVQPLFSADSGTVNDKEFRMSDQKSPVSPEVKKTVAETIVNGIEALIKDAEEETRPLEVDPFRSRLFEFFVTADGAGLVGDERVSSLQGDDESTDETNLSADGLCRSLARRWGLDMAARDSAAQQTKLPAEQLERMRLLWSVMRMWMEWNYAWCRWEEFHSAQIETLSD